MSDKPEMQSSPNTELYDAKKVSRRTFISSLTFVAGATLAYWGWDALYDAAKEPTGATAGARKPLRRVLNANGELFENNVSAEQLSRTYPKAMAVKRPRVNGDVGITDKELAGWKLKVAKSVSETFEFTLDEIKKLPKTEFAFEFKCVEGWSQVSHWGGVKFSDFVRHYGLHEQAKMQYVGLRTPDEKYYVGIDMPSAMHPQTLLCYEVSGQPLSPDHGAPLRLIIPTKYGIKNLKRIGTLFFSNERPPDYWAERGYDYFSGL
ncbi:molybdopterin-dependent oxidoreductase [Mucilaginibacter lacusdianchii]|uniref:molybdopterin-dependent oxidoreductase n=1 Tax=Mucilaginibacter lacusdianchii TaxID=2684211 RepID=UPI00131D657A|nr:molybdopterin-dependent oxidoreductase [Mucilaginibacter sp. JXJ CY 39]